MSNVPRWWVVDADDRVLAGPFTSEENTEPLILWITTLDHADSDAASAAYGVRRPDGTLERVERAQWWVIDAIDRIVTGPFTTEEDAEAGVAWVKAAAPFHVDGGLDAVVAAYGVRHRGDTLEHRAPTG